MKRWKYKTLEVPGFFSSYPPYHIYDNDYYEPNETDQMVGDSTNPEPMTTKNKLNALGKYGLELVSVLPPKKDDEELTIVILKKEINAGWVTKFELNQIDVKSIGGSSY